MTRTDEQTLFMFSATVTAEELYMQGLGKTMIDYVDLIDSRFYEPISMMKSQSMLFSVDERTGQIHLPSNKLHCYI